MKVAELRQSILQAAVQGKLVPQDPNDEPASELLKRIQQEKAWLIKEGKIKKEKPLPPILEDEIPYDLPEGWVWCRLYDYCDVRDGTHDTPRYVKDGIPLITSKNLKNGNVSFENVKYISLEDHMTISLRSKVDNGDILFAMIGSIGNPTVVNCDIEFSIKNVALFKPYPSTDFNGEYLYRVLLLIQNEMKQIASGGVQSFVSLNFLRRYLIPIPPVNEQQRIVTKIDELMTLCNELEAEEEDLDALEVRFTECLPKAILQAAVQGKLVPQNSHDEPASELLKRIQQEKAQFVKEGKLKKGKPLPPISEDEIPYNLPKGWVWCRLCDIGQIVGGATPDSHESSYYTKPGQGIAWLTPADMTRYTKNNYISHGAKDITQAGYNSCSTTLMPPGSIIFSSRAPIGHIAFSGKEVCTNQGFKSVVPHISAVAPWIFYVLKSKVDDIQSRASGTTFKEVSGKFMESEIILLPPLAEQQRITTKVDELMAFCEKLKAAYTAPISLDKTDNIIPFPAAKKEEETLLAARGDVGQLSNEAMQAFNDLFAEDEE